MDHAVEIIASLMSLIGVVITVVVGNNTTRKQIKSQSDLTLYRIDQLENRVKEHNQLIERMYNVERRLDLLEIKNKEE